MRKLNPPGGETHSSTIEEEAGGPRLHDSATASPAVIAKGATVGSVLGRRGHMSLRRERLLVLGVILVILGAGCQGALAAGEVAAVLGRRALTRPR